MKHIKIIAIGLLTALLQSCNVTKNYAQPDLKLPKSFDSIKKAGDNTITEIPSYQQFFTDKELMKILDKVLQNNPDLKIASEQIMISQTNLKNIKLNYLPDINLLVSTNLQRASKNSASSSSGSGLLNEEYSFAPTVSWDIDFWGKQKKQREEALSNYLSVAENRRALRVQLIALTAQAYYNLLSLDEQLRITQEVANNMEKTLDILKIQYKVGDVTSLAIKQSEAQLAETKALIPEIKASVKAQENALSTLAGSYPTLVERSQSFKNIQFGLDLNVGTPANLLANRPDVKQQELLLQSASARVGIAKTDFYPSFKITAQGGLSAIKAINWFSFPTSLFGNLAGGITQPIFNKKSIQSNYEQALHQREIAVLEFRKSVLNAVEEVSTSLNNISWIKEQMMVVNNRKISMEKAITDAQMLYKNGEANYLEVLLVQQSYFQTELACTLITQKEINSYIALYKSLGGN